jgi:hypothetical protein
MPGVATTIPAVRDAVEAALSTIQGLKIYDHSPREFDELPAVELGLVRIRRTEVDEAEGELGRTDWHFDIPLSLHVALDDPDVAQAEALELLGLMIGTFDANPTLGNSPGVIDTKLVEATGGFLLQAQDGSPLPRPQVLYECSLRSLVLIT